MLRYLLLFLFIGFHIGEFVAQADNTMDLLPSESEILSGYERDSVEKRMKEMPLHQIEGIWSFVNNGTIIAIERFNPDYMADINQSLYRIVIVEAPQRSIMPGTTMGYISPTAKRGNYDARIFTNGGLNGILSKPKLFNIVMTDDSRLSFNQYQKGVKVNLWRWIPYIFRVGVSTRQSRPNGLDGCLRIYPTSTTAPLNPRYL